MTGAVSAKQEAERLWELAREEHLLLRPHLSADALAEYREAFIAGGIEHGNDWVKWPLPRFEQERHAERIDIANYEVMENLLRKGIV